MGTFRRLAQAVGLVAKVELWPVEVGVLVKQMRSECPAAAYLFAATIFNSKELLADPSVEPATKLKHFDTELAFSQFDNLDAGIGRLSLRFVRAVVAHKERWGELNATSILMKSTWEDLEAFGQRYRDLEPRDQIPPRTQSAIDVLAKRNRKTVAEVIDAVRAEHEVGAGTPKSTEEDVQNLLAFFDVRDEWAGGKLATYVRKLDQIIPQPA